MLPVVSGAAQHTNTLGGNMRTALSLVLLMFSSLVFGGCNEWFGETDSTIVAITDDYCSKPLMLTISKKQKGRTPNGERQQSYPFKEECRFLDDGFVCHQKGRTILAGTTWELSKGGVGTGSKKPKCKIPYFTCINGCSAVIPNVLYMYYDGECE